MSARPEPAPARARVLIVEDESVLRDLLVRMLAGEGYAVHAVETGQGALERLGRELFDLVLLDLHLPDTDGMRVLSAAPALQTDARFIVMTAFGSVDTAVEAMKLGAFDFVNKPFRTEELLLTLDRAVRFGAAQREASLLQTSNGSDGRGRIVGDSPAMRRVFELVERVAPLRTSVLVTGETGTGKELVARAIHDLSPRARGHFVPVNCSALPESLLESELFGHTRGSFTGAVRDKRGLFEEADGGTLFLDEIATISAAIQVKLLRVLQERKIKRIGGNQPIPVDFRLIAASNVDLAREVEAGRFRADLHYRLNVFPVHVPPLRERREDIPLLVNFFRERFSRENGVAGPSFTPETVARVVEHEWPGNVRELENFVERSLIMHAGAASVPVEAPPARGREEGGEAELLERALGKTWTLERLERAHILAVLRGTEGHRGRAAEILGIHARTLTRKLRQYAEEGTLPDEISRLLT